MGGAQEAGTGGQDARTRRRRGAWPAERECGVRAGRRRGDVRREGSGARRPDVRGDKLRRSEETSLQGWSHQPCGPGRSLGRIIKDAFGTQSGPTVLLGSPPPGRLGSGKRKQGKTGEMGTHRPWSPSPHSDSSPLPPSPPLNRYHSPWWRPREAGEGPDPELERLPLSWAIAPRVPHSRRAAPPLALVASVSLR